MRGHVSGQGPMFLMIHIEEKVPADHPLRAVKRRCDRILAQMRRDFHDAYSRLAGRASRRSEYWGRLVQKRPGLRADGTPYSSIIPAFALRATAGRRRRCGSTGPPP